VPAVKDTMAVTRKTMPGSFTKPAEDSNAKAMHGLENSQAQGAVAGVLGDFATPCFAFFFQRFHAGHHIRHQLHDDGCRDVRHDAQRKNTEARQSATREHIEEAENAALLTFEQLSELIGVDAGDRDMCADAVNNQCEQQKDKPTTQVAILICFGQSAGGHGICVLSSVLKRQSRQRLRSPLWHLLWHQCH